MSRGKTVTTDHFWGFVENGLALVSDIYCWDHECWVATGTGFGEDMTFADLVMRPDLSTFRVLPHVAGQARVICDMEYSDGRPVEASPRRVLQRVVERAAAQGLTALMQAEYEFYLLDAGTRLPPFGGTDITTTLTNQRLAALPEIVRHLQALGLRPRTLNQEWGPTQYELTFSPVEGLAGGDDNFTYKTYAKEIAVQHGLLASFMTKPFIDASGSSSHLHMSLFDGGRNIFWDAAQGELTPEFWLGDRRAARPRGGAERVPRADRQLRRSATGRARTHRRASRGASRTGRSRSGSRPDAAMPPTSRTGSARPRRTRTSRWPGCWSAMLDGVARRWSRRRRCRRTPTGSTTSFRCRARWRTRWRRSRRTRRCGTRCTRSSCGRSSR